MKTLFALCICLFCLPILHAQKTDSSFIHHTFSSEAFREERKLTVHLPSRYFANAEEAMMVTYVLDAQGPQYFNMLCANLDYLTSRYGIIPTIVVGIHSKNRYKEFTPFARPGNTIERETSLESRLPNLYKHLESEVFPWVEKNYRTKPFRAIIGHSRGGSFVVQCLFDGHKNLFDAYLAISPVLSFDNYQSVDHAKQVLESKEELNKFFYASSGDVGEGEIFYNMNVEKLDTVIKKHPNPSLVYHRWFFPEKDHFTTVIPSVSQGMVLLKNEYMASLENIYAYAKNESMPISAQIDAFVQEKKKTNSFIHEPPMGYYRSIADEFRDNDDYEKALDLYLWAEKQEPIEKWWHFFNVGMCYSHFKQKEDAAKYFNQALVRLEDWKEEYGENFEKIKQDVQKQIKEYLE